MKSAFFLFFLIAAVCAAVFYSSELTAADKSQKTDESGWVLPGANVGADWFVHLKDARAQATKENKPILIVFSGPDWSSASKKFESSVLKSKEFSASIRPAAACLYIQHFINVSAPEDQISTNLALRKALNVPAVYPCTVILASDGKTLLGIIQGAPDKKVYLQQVSKLAGIKLEE